MQQRLIFTYKGLKISAAVLNVHGWYCDKTTESCDVHWSTCKRYSLLPFMVPAVSLLGNPVSSFWCFFLNWAWQLEIFTLSITYHWGLAPNSCMFPCFSFCGCLKEDILLGICLQIKYDCVWNETPYVYYRCSSFVIWRHPAKLASLHVLGCWCPTVPVPVCCIVYIWCNCLRLFLCCYHAGAN
jgi:hypothetical protein